MSDEYPGWEVEKLQEIKEWAIDMIVALNVCLIQADIEPIEVIK